jgi:GGDEF domain-containing protein
MGLIRKLQGLNRLSTAAWLVLGLICVGEMDKHGWPTTFSIGVVTFTEVPRSVDEMLNLADDVMYNVKRGSKNSIRYAEFSEGVRNEPVPLHARPSL